MTLDLTNKTLTHTNDTNFDLSQGVHHQPSQRPTSRALRVAASAVLTGLLAFSGGIGYGITADYLQDGQLTFLVKEVK